MLEYLSSYESQDFELKDDPSQSSVDPNSASLSLTSSLSKPQDDVTPPTNHAFTGDMYIRKLHSSQKPLCTASPAVSAKPKLGVSDKKFNYKKFAALPPASDTNTKVCILIKNFFLFNCTFLLGSVLMMLVG